MRDRIRIHLEGELDVDPEALDRVNGDALLAAQDELGFTGLGILNAEVREYLDEDDDEPAEDLYGLDPAEVDPDARLLWRDDQ